VTLPGCVVCFFVSFDGQYSGTKYSHALVVAITPFRNATHDDAVVSRLFS
jgi:hypothetical protein